MERKYHLIFPQQCLPHVQELWRNWEAWNMRFSAVGREIKYGWQGILTRKVTAVAVEETMGQKFEAKWQI